MLDAPQLLGQRLATGLVAWRLGARRRGVALQRAQLRLQPGLVLGERFFEQAPLLGAHRFGLGAVLPRLQPRELEGDLLELGALELKLGVLALDLARLLADVREHLRGHVGHRARVEPLQVLGLERMHIEHGQPLCEARSCCVIRACANCLARAQRLELLTCA